ncbi:MAG: hypothetical protein CVV34_04160, partial [Methanomicrobiales archaeon HGW-Methanomicrobiales-5]
MEIPGNAGASTAGKPGGSGTPPAGTPEMKISGTAGIQPFRKPVDSSYPGYSPVPGSPSEQRSPVSIEKGPGPVFQIGLLLANRGYFGLFHTGSFVCGIGKCAEFGETGCKFNFI